MEMHGGRELWLSLQSCAAEYLSGMEGGEEIQWQERSCKSGTATKSARVQDKGGGHKPIFPDKV